jgi:hypothetical protein
MDITSMDGLRVWTWWTTLCALLTTPQLQQKNFQLIELKDREERRRLTWIVAYRE